MRNIEKFIFIVNRYFAHFATGRSDAVMQLRVENRVFHRSTYIQNDITRIVSESSNIGYIKTVNYNIEESECLQEHISRCNNKNLHLF